MNIDILDCTLRDGGYVNNWFFGYDNIRTIITNLCKANLNYIELGFLNENEADSTDRTMISSMENANKILAGIDKRNAKIMAMINFGNFSIKNVLPKDKTLIDGIRVMVKKEKIDDALSFCNKLKDKGYIVSANVVAINRYNRKDLIELIKKANNSNIDILTFADTYGICNEKNLNIIANVANKYLNENISIGFHSHNSFQRAYTNTIYFIKKVHNHHIIVDGSLYGMGKGAGNACLELLVNSLNNEFGTNYNDFYIENLIENIILKEFSKNPWGYQMTYYIAASSLAHQDYISYFHNKDIEYNEIKKIVKYLPEKDKFTYSLDAAQKAFEKYQNRKKCVIFDIDGTLLNTAEGIANSMDYAAKSLGYPLLSKEKKYSIIGPSITKVFKEVYNETDENAKKLVKNFRDYYQDKELLNYVIYDGIEDLLKKLVNDGYVLAVATNKRKDLAIKLINDSSLSKYFTIIEGTDQFGTITKTDLIVSIKKTLGIENTDVIMIGDTYSDYNAALNANVNFIGVSYGYGFKNDDDIIKWITMVDKPEKLIDFIERKIDNES